MGTIRFIYRPTNLPGVAVPQPQPPARPDPKAAVEPDSAPMSLESVKVDRWWRQSSFDLWQGLEVREDPPDTMPAEWLDDHESGGDTR